MNFFVFTHLTKPFRGKVALFLPTTNILKYQLLNTQHAKIISYINVKKNKFKRATSLNLKNLTYLYNIYY